jgi:hypothetical protein
MIDKPIYKFQYMEKVCWCLCFCPEQLNRIYERNGLDLCDLLDMI